VTTAAIVLAAFLAVAAVLWVARPYLRSGNVPEGAAESEGELAYLRLLEARDRALAALKELEFDHRTGKVSQDDYRALVRTLRQEAASAVAAVDKANEGGEEASR
jgi:hypothetical protein